MSSPANNNVDATRRTSVRHAAFSPRGPNALVVIGGSPQSQAGGDQASTVSNLTLTTEGGGSSSSRGLPSTGRTIGTDAFQDLVNRAEDEEKNGGDGEDSDNEGEEYFIHAGGSRTRTKEVDEVHHTSEGAEEDIAEDNGESFSEHKAFFKLTASGGTQVIGRIAATAQEEEGSVVLDGENAVSKKISMHKPPPEWKAMDADPARSLPAFENVDNPGNWNSYCYRPTFDSRRKDSKYASHCLPTGARPVPVNPDIGKRAYNGWEFFYDGWKNPEMPYRRGASTSNMFPQEMNGSLDGNILRAHGLTKERMLSSAPLFFFQLLLPICDPRRSGIDNDTRLPYYTEVERFTNMSKAESGYGGSYGHSWKATNGPELLRFDGVHVRDGVYGGSKGNLHIRFEEPGSFTRDEDICDALTFTRYTELKRNMKLCHNGSCAKRGEPNYDPAYKYDLIYKTLVHNVNAITKYADENLTVDETTWGFCGFGEAGAGLCGRLRGKKVPKGGQVVLVTDSGRVRPRAYIHRHKLHTLPTGFTRQGCGELHYLLNKVSDMVIGTAPSNSTSRKIFRMKPTTTVDNFFTDDRMMNWAGENGLGVIGTSARNFLPKSIKREHLHHVKTAPTSKEAKVARFTKPIVAVKDEETNGKKYQRVHVSFQSTSSCNITSVNALNECDVFVELRERGRGSSKRYWGIEMNDARRVYLSTYFRIDVMDHLLKNANLYYRTWKYWHSPVNHAKAIVITVAYDMYLECTEGKLDAEWKIEKPLTYFEFRRILSTQMLKYSPQKQLYPGDQFMRSVTSLTQSARKRKAGGDGMTTATQVRHEKRSGRSRLCGNIDKLCRHVECAERTPGKKARICAWCGTDTYTMCGICKDPKGKSIPLHLMPQKGKAAGQMCFYHYHNDHMFGLGKNDMSAVLNGVKSEWEAPTPTDVRQNREHIKSLGF